MERLTTRCSGYAVMAWEHEEKHTAQEWIDMLTDRLAAYEDTGLEPDVCSNYRKFEDEAISKGVTFKRIVELMNADHDGRLVVLPCKVGDSVYIPDLDKKIPVKVRVQGISISVSGRTILHFGGYPVECAWGDGCGKDWFLTREEAEAALAQKGGGG